MLTSVTLFEVIIIWSCNIIPYFGIAGLLMALGKILLGRWTADIYLEDCLMIRSTGVDNEDCA